MEVLSVFLFSGINIAMTEIYILSVMLSALLLLSIEIQILKYHPRCNIICIGSASMWHPV